MKRLTWFIVLICAFIGCISPIKVLAAYEVGWEFSTRNPHDFTISIDENDVATITYTAWQNYGFDIFVETSDINWEKVSGDGRTIKVHLSKPATSFVIRNFSGIDINETLNFTYEVPSPVSELFSYRCFKDSNGEYYIIVYFD